MIDKNVEYYNQNADSFFAGSLTADMSEVQNRFLSYVPAGGRILDAGCGSGRDSKAFLDAGYEVVSFDASEEMCKRASEYIGHDVINMRFEDISYDHEFDGIWACATLLHVPMDELPGIMRKMHAALKTNGAMYASFKYGDGTTTRGERLFRISSGNPRQFNCRDESAIKKRSKERTGKHAANVCLLFSCICAILCV